MDVHHDVCPGAGDSLWQPDLFRGCDADCGNRLCLLRRAGHVPDAWGGDRMSSEIVTLPLWVSLPVIFFLILGSLIILIGALGLMRLPHFYQRIHGPAISVTLGAGCLLIASMIYFTALQSRLVDRKSTRLNSSHVRISYAVFCLKKKKILRG